MRSLRSWWAATRAGSTRQRAAHTTHTAAVSDDGLLRRTIGDGKFGTVAGRRGLSGGESQAVRDSRIVNDDAIIRTRQVYPGLHQGNPCSVQGNRHLTRRRGGYRPDHRRLPVRGALGAGDLPAIPRPVTIPARIVLPPVTLQGIEIVGPPGLVGG